jgi:hypothetical protein
MTQFFTYQSGAATYNDVGLISITETTADRRIFVSSASPNDGYNDLAVRRIRKANRGPFTRAPDNSDELLKWLET